MTVSAPTGISSTLRVPFKLKGALLFSQTQYCILQSFTFLIRQFANWLRSLIGYFLHPPSKFEKSMVPKRGPNCFVLSWITQTHAMEICPVKTFVRLIKPQIPIDKTKSQKILVSPNDKEFKLILNGSLFIVL